MKHPRYQVTIRDWLGWFVRRWSPWPFSVRDVAAVRFLRQLSDWQRRLPDDRSPGSPLAFRKDIRSILASEPWAGLIWSGFYGEQETRVVAVWILAQLGFARSKRLALHFTGDENPKIRKQAVKGLQRLGAWSDLRKIASSDPDPEVRRWAVELPPRPFDSRLRCFIDRHAGSVGNRVGDSPVAIRMPAILVRGGGFPPKPPIWIRNVLLRIALRVRKSRL